MFKNLKILLNNTITYLSDIGGYTSIPQVADLVPDPPIRDKELLLRWAEYSVFTPMMRTHEGNR